MAKALVNAFYSDARLDELNAHNKKTCSTLKTLFKMILKENNVHDYSMDMHKTSPQIRILINHPSEQSIQKLKGEFSRMIQRDVGVSHIETQFIVA